VGEGFCLYICPEAAEGARHLNWRDGSRSIQSEEKVKISGKLSALIKSFSSTNFQKGNHKCAKNVTFPTKISQSFGRGNIGSWEYLVKEAQYFFQRQGVNKKKT
jgi:hypothetical protein